MRVRSRRADAVAAVLRAERPDLKLTVTAYGKTRLLVTEGDEAANRRVEISYETDSG